jgi:hypothetical protein
MIGSAFEIGTPQAGDHLLEYTQELIDGIKELSLLYSWLSTGQRQEYWSNLDDVVGGKESIKFEYRPENTGVFDHEIKKDYSDEDFSKYWFIYWDNARKNVRIRSEGEDFERQEESSTNYWYDHEQQMITVEQVFASELDSDDPNYDPNYTKKTVMWKVDDPMIRDKNGVCLSFTYDGTDRAGNDLKYRTHGYADDTGGVIKITPSGQSTVTFSFDAQGSPTSDLFPIEVCNFDD